MILGVAWLLAANAASGAVAAAIFRRVRTGMDLDWPVFLLLRLTVISAAVLLAGLIGALTPAALGIAGLSALIFLRIARVPWTVRLPRIEPGRVLLVLAAVVAIRLCWQVSAFAPHVPDTLVYHLPKIAEWIRAGGFTREMGLDPRAHFPSGFELVEAWWVVFLRHDALIEMAGVEFLLVAFAATYSLGKTLGLASRPAFLAGLAYILTPGMHLQATSCLNDGPVAALLVSVLALVAGRAPAPLVAWVMGLGIGIKPTFGYALPGIAILGWLARREPSTPVPSRRAAVGIAIAGLALGAFWYARNLVWQGNPIYPMGLGGMLGSGGRTAQQLGPSLSSLWENLWTFWDIRILDRAPYGSMTDFNSGWGAAAVCCGLPALVFALREDSRWRRMGVAFAASLISVFALVFPDRWYMRFVLFVPALLALATARMAQSFRGSLPLIAGALLFQFAGTFVPKELSERPTINPALQLSRGEAVACFGDRWGRIYVLYERDYSRPLIYLRPTTPEELIDQVRRSGVRVLLGNPARRSDQDLLEQAVLLGGFRKVDGFFYIVAP